jgi:hypothetical protein
MLILISVKNYLKIISLTYKAELSVSLVSL